MPKKLVELSEIIFEPQDSEIFKIPDVKTRIATLQNYFFPRMEMLLRHTLKCVQEVYEVNPYERMTFAYRPSNRKDAKVTHFRPEVYVGICGKRIIDEVLITKHRDGTPYHYHATYLTYTVYPKGYMGVELDPYRYHVDENLADIVTKMIREHRETLWPILSMNRIAYRAIYDRDNHRFGGPEDAFSLAADGSGGWLTSAYRYFPVDIEHGLYALISAFVVLYPIVDSMVLIEKGKAPRLGEMLAKLQAWYLKSRDESPPGDDEETVEPDEVENETDIEIPELDSYTYVRAGLRWEVLARDNWTCCSCGRSTKQDGVILHVDHILPRSKGGTDEIDNLQTLCSKCNIGKSNRDDTDLRNMLCSHR